MNKDAEKRIAAQLAKAMAMICVRNTLLEDLHAGPGPVTRTGDYSDVLVLDADGKRIPWSEVSRINDDDPGLRSEIDRWTTVTRKWDAPELDAGMTRSVDKPGR